MNEALFKKNNFVCVIRIHIFAAKVFLIIQVNNSVIN